MAARCMAFSKLLLSMTALVLSVVVVAALTRHGCFRWSDINCGLRKLGPPYPMLLVVAYSISAVYALTRILHYAFATCLGSWAPKGIHICATLIHITLLAALGTLMVIVSVKASENGGFSTGDILNSPEMSRFFFWGGWAVVVCYALISLLALLGDGPPHKKKSKTPEDKNRDVDMEEGKVRELALYEKAALGSNPVE